MSKADKTYPLIIKVKMSMTCTLVTFVLCSVVSCALNILIRVLKPNSRYCTKSMES